MEQLSPRTTTTEPVLRAHEPQLLKTSTLEPLLCNQRGHRNEKPEHRIWRVAPFSVTRESRNKKPEQAKRKKERKFKNQVLPRGLSPHPPSLDNDFPLLSRNQLILTAHAASSEKHPQTSRVGRTPCFLLSPCPHISTGTATALRQTSVA